MIRAAAEHVSRLRQSLREGQAEIARQHAAVGETREAPGRDVALDQNESPTRRSKKTASVERVKETAGSR